MNLQNLCALDQVVHSMDLGWKTHFDYGICLDFEATLKLLKRFGDFGLLIILQRLVFFKILLFAPADALPLLFFAILKRPHCTILLKL